MENTALIYKELNLRYLRNVTLLILYAIVAFYFLINGEGLFDDWTSSWTWSTVIYLLGVSLFLSIQEKLPKDLEQSLVKSTIGFFGAFLLCTTLFIILKDVGVYFTTVQALPIKAIIPTLIFQSVIVVTSEEIIFRGVIFRFLYQFHYLLAIILSSVLFSLFHFVVYQGSIGALSIAFIMGIILAWCVMRWNIGVAIGIHFAWNAFVLGATVIM